MYFRLLQKKNMAILGSLRKNSVVLITVIGMALFAFVISGVFDGKGYVAQDPIGIVNDQDLSRLIKI